MDYDLLCAQLKSLAEAERWYVPLLSNAAALLYDALEAVNWAGFYLIPLGRGVCGTAAQRDATLLVPDVHAFAGHIACDSASNSEIVVPIHRDGKVAAVLDIDSPVKNRFTEADRAGLEAFVRVLEREMKIDCESRWK